MRSGLVSSNSLLFNNNLLKIVKIGQTGWQGLKGTCVQTCASEFDASKMHMVEGDPGHLDTVLWLLHTHHGMYRVREMEEIPKWRIQRRNRSCLFNNSPLPSSFSVSSFLSTSPESKADTASSGLSQSFVGILQMGESVLPLSKRSDKIPGHMSCFTCYILVTTFSGFTNFRFSHVK